MASDSPRPPQPISPMLMRSLAPITRPLALLELLAAAIALVAADSAPTDFRKFLRSTESLDMNAPSYSPLKLFSGVFASHERGDKVGSEEPTAGLRNLLARNWARRRRELTNDRTAHFRRRCPNAAALRGAGEAHALVQSGAGVGGRASW